MAHAGQGIAGSGVSASAQGLASRIRQGLRHQARTLATATLALLLAATSLAHAQGNSGNAGNAGNGKGKGGSAPPATTQITHLGKSGQGQGTLVVSQGAVGVLQATLSPAPTAAGVLTLSSSRPSSVSVPASIAFAAGQTQVAVPVNAELKGQADVTASLNGSSRSAKVNVVPAPARLVSLSPAQLTLAPGATATLQVALSPRQPGGAITLQLLSSDPAKVYVPASLTLAEGQASASFEVRGMAAGTARITAQVAGGGHTTHASAQVQVQAVGTPLAVVGLLPPTSSVEQGAQTTLTVQLSAAAPTPTTVALAARTPGVLGLPASVVVPAGHTQASFPVTGLATGQTLVVASLNGPNGASSAEAAVQVTPLPARVAAIEPAQSQLAVGAQATLQLRLNAAQPTDTRISLSTTPPGVAQVPAELIVPPGQTQADLPATGIAPGQAQVLASLNGSTRSAAITVVPAPIRLQALLPNPLGIQAGASGELTVRLDATSPEPLSITLLSSQSSVAQLPASLTIPAGAREQTVIVSGIGAGQATLTARLTHNGVQSTATSSVQVAEPPPRLAAIEPNLLDVPLGASAELTVQLDRAPLLPTTVAMANANPTAVQVPEQVTVPAGALSVVVPVLTLQQGSAVLTASLNGSTNSATVRVVPPQIVAITVSPAQLELGALQTAPLQAQGSFSDGSTQDITTQAATTWRSDDSAIASVNSTGQATGQQTGQTTVHASQTPAALQGQGAPQPVQGSAAVVVGPAGALVLSAERTALPVGQSASVLVALPYPQTQAVTVNLQTTTGLQAPASLVIAAGDISASVIVQATATGAATLSASAAAPHSAFSPAQLAFSLTPAQAAGPVISSVAPHAAAPGTPITLSGSGFATTPGANTVVFTADAAGGAPAVVQSASATQLVVTVPATAQTGPIAVTTTAGTGQSPVFTVQREQAFDLQSSPAQLSVMQGSQASAVITLASSGVRPYEGLARLSITGLPAGVTARFEPAQISAQQSGQLILSAADSAALGSSTLTLQASATLDGLPWIRQSQITAQVITRADVTGVKGRFVNREGQGVAGVIVRLENSSSNQVVSDAAGNFLITGLPGGVSTLRFDATPAHSLYPIWPYSVSLQAGELRTLADWTINPPPADEQFTPIANATADQAITDPRYPGFAVTLPAGVSITGWDGVKKTRIAVERLTPDQLPVSAPPFAMKEAYQLYFGTPMGGIPSQPIPVTLPNVTGKAPGEEAEIWFFDGSPMGGTGEWKMAGLGTVSADGQSVTSNPGTGLPRFCGVCGLACLKAGQPASDQTNKSDGCDGAAKSEGNPINLFSGQARARLGGPSCGGRIPIEPSWQYTPIDPFNNAGGSTASFGMGWTLGYDAVVIPFDGPRKRLVMPGGVAVDLVADPANPGSFRVKGDPRYDGFTLKAVGSAPTAGGRNGEVWELTTREGSTWRFDPFTEYTTIGGIPAYLTQVKDRHGNTLAIERNARGHATRISGADSGSSGRELSIAYGPNGFAREVKDHTNRTQTFSYDSEDRVSEVIDAAGRSTRFGYHEVPYYNNNPADKTATACFEDTPLSIVERTGPIVIDFRKYPHQRHLASIQYPHSSTPTVNTHNTDRVVRQTTSSGETWHFSYRRVGACVVKVADEAARTWAYSCRAGQPLSSAKAGTASGTAALSGLCPEIDSEETRAQGWRFYGGHNAETVVTRPDGTTTRQRYDAKGMVIDETDSAGQRTQRRYDSESRLLSTTDPLGRVTKFEYDANGNRVATTDPLGHRVETAFDPSHNQPTRQTRFLLGVPSQQGGLQLSYTPLNTTYTLDAKGQLTQVQDPTGIAAQMAYDNQGLLRQLTLPARTTASALPITSEGQSASIPKADRKLSLAYNAAGDLIRITDALNNATDLNTDNLGRTTQLTDALGHRSTQRYNDIDQPTEAKNPLNHTTQLTYDAAGRVTSVINEMGVAIESYVYDTAGRVIEVRDALNQTTNIEYDSSNRPNKITDRKGQVTTLGYTERGQIASIQRPDQSIQVQYDAVGRLTEVRDNTSVNSYRFDAADRLIETRSTTAAGTHTLSYELDSLDRVKTRTLSGTGIQAPEVTTYSWDHADRLLSHSTTLGNSSHRTEYEYDAAGRLAARHAQAGDTGKLTQRYGYDQAERLSQIKYIRNEGTTGEQLIEQIDYSYDTKGQRTAKTTLNHHGSGLQDTPFTATFDAANRMTAITLNAGGQAKSYTLTHDANGNLTRKTNTADSADQTTYTWDSNNRLIGITQPNLSASFTYDAYGRRIQSSITEGGSTRTVQYLYEGQQALGEIRDQKLSHRLLTGLSLDETIARMAINASGNKEATASRLFMTDALNSVIAQMNDDETASLASSYAYSPYGESQTIGPDSTSNPIQYTSRENDGTGLLYHRARYRDPVLGGWLSEDPAGFVDGFNRLAYVRGDPVSFFDTDGERSGASPHGRPPNRPSSRQMRRAGIDPNPRPQMSVNRDAHRLIHSVGDAPSLPGSPLPGDWPGINSHPLPLPQISTQPMPPGCRLICDESAPGQCTREGRCRLWCGSYVDGW